jgi:oligopeptide transport system permease protein
MSAHHPPPEAFAFAPPPSAAPPPPVHRGGRTGRIFRRLFARKSAALALMALIALILLSIFGPAMNPYGYNDQKPEWANLPPRMPGLAALGIFDGTAVLYSRQADSLDDTAKYPPGSVRGVVRQYTQGGVAMVDIRVDAYALAGAPEGVTFGFGADYLGRDLWTRTWRGCRTSLIIAGVAVCASMLFGTVYGAVAGYFGGAADMILMRVAEVAGAFPQAIVAVLLVMLIGPGMGAIIAAVALRGWVGAARLMRGQTLALRGRAYVLAARTLGAGVPRLIFRHILPGAAGPLITRAALEAPGAIFSEAFLAYIGLGLAAPACSMGVLLSDAQRTLTVYPWQTLFPAVMLSLLMLCFNLLGAGLRAALRPHGEGEIPTKIPKEDAHENPKNPGHADVGQSRRGL